MASFSLSQGMDLLRSKRFSDFTILCEGHEFPVHRNIIYQKSEFFAACIEGSFCETNDAAVTIQETDAIAVACVILWVYTGVYSMDMVNDLWPKLRVESETKNPGFDVLLRHVLIYELGERLLLPDLKVHVADRVSNDIHEDGLFHRFTCDVVVQFLKDVYSRTAVNDDGLRALVTTYCIEKHQILESDDYKDAMDIIQEHEKVGWKIGIAIQLKAEKAEEEALEREAAVYRKAACCHSSNEL